MGKTITVAAPGAANMQFAEPTLEEIKKMSFQEQSQVMCDLANRADTPICRTYATWTPNIKLGFWYRLGEWMEQGIVAPIPEGYKLSANAQAVLQTLQGLDSGQQITVLRNTVLDMGFDSSKMDNFTRVMVILKSKSRAKFKLLGLCGSRHEYVLAIFAKFGK